MGINLIGEEDQAGALALELVARAQAWGERTPPADPEVTRGLCQLVVTARSRWDQHTQELLLDALFAMRRLTWWPTREYVPHRLTVRALARKVHAVGRARSA